MLSSVIDRSGLREEVTGKERYAADMIESTGPPWGAGLPPA
jgi:hypothetical protein